MNTTQELTRLGITRKIINLVPNRIKFRVAKLLYNYQSPNVKGVDITVPYFPEYNLKFYLNTKDLIGWNIYFFGQYEKLTNKILKACLKETDVVVEAGANNGSETVLISKLVSKGKVFAFEPIPHVLDRLNYNIEINDLRANVKIFDIALGEKDTTVQFHILPKDFPNQGMSSKYGSHLPSEQLTVKQKKLDTWVKEENITRIDFIKMDIQGAEIDLLIGGEECIQKFKPIIFTEADDQWNGTKNLYMQLMKLNYSVYLISNGKLQGFNESHLVDGNWIAFHKDYNIDSIISKFNFHN